MSVSKPTMIAIALLLLAMSAFAEDYVAVNSIDGRDVLSGIFYANVKGIPVKFMPSAGIDPDLFAGKVGIDKSVLLIQSTNQPISTFVQNALKSKNDTVEMYMSADGGGTNLDLAKRSGANSFILVDSAYSDGAISVLSYAALSKSYVILTSKDNANEVKQIVQGKHVVIYGYVDKEVKDAVSSTNPEIIGTGDDKFQDNILIVNKTMRDYGVNTFIATDGAFLEDSMTVGNQALLLIGQLIPPVTYDFVKSEVKAGNLKSVMLIGNQMVVPVYDMRERMRNEFKTEGASGDFGIVVKFAQVIPATGSGVLNLDLFYLPAYLPSMAIDDVAYNNADKKIMVSVNNTGDGLAYYTMEVRVKSDGQDVKIFPASGTPVAIQRGETGGSEFDFDMSNISEGNITAAVVVKYGATKSSLESFTTKEGPLATIQYVDKSDVSIQSAKYDKDKKQMQVTVRNNGGDKAYAFAKLNLVLSGQATTITGAGTRELAPSSMYVEEFPLDLSEQDLAANKNVTVSIDYGARPGFLKKTATKSVSIESDSGLPVMLIIGAIIVVVIVVAIAGALLFFVMRKKKK